MQLLLQHQETQGEEPASFLSTKIASFKLQMTLDKEIKSVKSST